MKNTHTQSKLKHYARLVFKSENEMFWIFEIISHCDERIKKFLVHKDQRVEYTDLEYIEMIATTALQNLFDGVKIIGFPVKNDD